MPQPEMLSTTQLQMTGTRFKAGPAVMMEPGSSSNLLSLAQRSVLERARREQLLDLQPPRRQPMLMCVLQERFDGGPVRLDSVRIPVAPNDLLLFFDHRLQPGERRLRRTGFEQQPVRILLRAQERFI